MMKSRLIHVLRFRIVYEAEAKTKSFQRDVNKNNIIPCKGS